MAFSQTGTLRPLSAGQLLDQAIRLYRRDFVRLIGIVAVVQIPVAAIQIATSTLTLGSMTNYLRSITPQMLEQGLWARFIGVFFGVILLSFLSYFLTQIVGMAALSRGIADRLLGQPAGILETYRKIIPLWKRLVALFFLLLLVDLGLLIWLLVPCIGWLTGPSMLMFFGLAITPLIAPVLVLEDKEARQAIRRAWELVRRRFWWVCGFVLIFYVFNRVIVLGPTFLAEIGLLALIGRLGSQALGPILNTIVSSVIQMLFSLIYLPLEITAICLMYLDLRVRTEGFDLEIQASQTSISAEGAPGGTVDIAGLLAGAPAAGETSLITSSELGKFALISLGFVAVYFVLFSAILALGMAASLLGQ
jgi:hypothetical protein